METTQTASPSGQPESNDYRHGRCHRRGRGGIVAILLTAFIAGAAGVYVGKSFAQGYGPLAVHGAFMTGDPAKANERIERMVKHLSVEVDATPEQRQKLEVIVKDAAVELAPLAVSMRAGRKQALELLGAPAVDPAAIERLRTEQIRLADTISQRFVRAIADAANVLTPEQRQKLAARVNDRMERFERFRRG